MTLEQIVTELIKKPLFSTVEKTIGYGGISHWENLKFKTDEKIVKEISKFFIDPGFGKINIIRLDSIRLDKVLLIGIRPYEIYIPAIGDISDYYTVTLSVDHIDTTVFNAKCISSTLEYDIVEKLAYRGLIQKEQGPIKKGCQIYSVNISDENL